MRFIKPLVVSIFTILFLLGCHKDEIEIEQTLPIAEFSYVIVKEGNEALITFVNKSQNATSFIWVINDDIVFKQKELSVKVKYFKHLSVKLTASNSLGDDVQFAEIDIPQENNTVNGVSYSWWCDPISQYYNGFNYFSGIDTLGRQMIYLYQAKLNKTISKVINSGHKRDEHNTAAFIFVGDNILSACAGHDQEMAVKIKKFDANLSEGFISEKLVSFPGSTSYSQLQRCGNRIFLAARCINKWYITWSDDDGDSWIEPKRFIEKALRPSNSFYLRMISVSDNQIKIGAYMHPVDMKDDGQKLFYASLNTNTGEIYKENDTSLGNLYNSSYTAFDLFDMTLIHKPVQGETFRFLDIANTNNGEETAFLIADANSNDFTQGNYALVRREHNTATTRINTIVPHGKSLPHPTYWGGAYFVVDYNYKWSGKDIFLARESQNNWMVEKYGFNGESFDLIKQIENYKSQGEKTLSRPLPPIGSELGGLAVIYQKGIYYGWPSYTNWQHMELILIDSSLNPINDKTRPGEIVEVI